MQKRVKQERLTPHLPGLHKVETENGLLYVFHMVLQQMCGGPRIRKQLQILSTDPKQVVFFFFEGLPQLPNLLKKEKKRKNSFKLPPKSWLHLG